MGKRATLSIKSTLFWEKKPISMSQFCVKTLKYFSFTISRCTLFAVIQLNAGAHRIECECAIIRTTPCRSIVRCIGILLIDWLAYGKWLTNTFLWSKYECVKVQLCIAMFECRTVAMLYARFFCGVKETMRCMQSKKNDLDLIDV